MKAFPHMAKVHMLDGNSIIKEEITSGGMDLRDYFAAKAMQSYIESTHNGTWNFDSVANMAYLMADTMLERREK